MEEKLFLAFGKFEENCKEVSSVFNVEFICRTSSL